MQLRFRAKSDTSLASEDILHKLILAGHKRMVMRSDGEPSMLAWDIATGKKLHDVEAVPEESAANDSKGSVLVEHAIRQVYTKIGTLKKQVDELYELELGDPSLICGVRGDVYQHWADGRAWELRHGTSCIAPVSM